MTGPDLDHQQKIVQLSRLKMEPKISNFDTDQKPKIWPQVFAKVIFFLDSPIKIQVDNITEFFTSVGLLLRK